MPVLRCLLFLVVVVVSAACGMSGGAGEGERERRWTMTSEPAKVRVEAMVLEDKWGGPRACVGGIAMSYPPQCGGPDIVGWDWSRVKDYEGGPRAAGKARWGDYMLAGIYEPRQDRLSLTEVPISSKEYRRTHKPDDLAGEPDPFTTPCRTPPGGWRVLNPATTNDEALDEADRVARSHREFGELWGDHSRNPARDIPSDELTLADEIAVNDPTKMTLNVTTTGDIAEMRDDIRDVWGGALCVSRSKFSERELQEIVDSIPDGPEVTSVSSGRDVVEVEVVWDDGSVQERADQKFGRGTVKIYSALGQYRPWE